jgi:nucleoside-diphosphate-sugar epimerase
MDIEGSDVLILGGSGLVGMAVARELMIYEPRTARDLGAQRATRRSRL